MSDNTPDIEQTEDVDGHRLVLSPEDVPNTRAMDGAPSIRIAGTEPGAASEDDVEGHRVFSATDEDDVEGHRVFSATDEDDVEGHRVFSANDEDDVEGHRAL